MQNNNIKIGVLDIETAPLESYTWGLWEQNVGLDQIKTEWSILSYAFKDLDSKKIVYQCTGGRGIEKVRNDATLLMALWKILNDYDVIVAQNGRRFDVKKINARFILSGLPPYSPIRIVDTLEVAKRQFAFTSNKLEWTSKYLTKNPKSKHKKFPGFELWAECLKDNPKAWAELKKYNIQDVVATEEYYLQLRPWITNHPNVGVYVDGNLPCCPTCGSSKIQRRGYAYTQASRYPRFQCISCGKWSRGKQMQTTMAVRKAILV